MSDNNDTARNARHAAYLATKEKVYGQDLLRGKIERSNFEVNKRFLRRTAVLSKGDKVLEIGCGAGSMTAHLASLGCDAIGIDVSRVLLSYAEQRYPKSKFLHMLGERLEFPDRTFDSVLSFDVLEHIPDVDTHLAEVRRVLRPTGHYLLQTPNKWTNIAYSILRQKSLTKWRKAHPSLQTRSSLTSLMQANGFAVEFIPMKVFNEFTRDKLVFPFNHINLDRLSLHTNHYAVARAE